LRWAGYGTLLAGGLFIGGFLRFADTVASLKPPANPTADAIVVLTGGYLRIDQAVALLDSGAGKRLLISGVHPDTSADELRQLTRTSKTLFNCCVDIGYEALDTIGNASESANWVKQHGFSKVLVVTNNYHMPRSLMELKRADPDTDYIAFPVVNSDLASSHWMKNPQTFRTILTEYVKIAAASIGSNLPRESGQGLRKALSFQTGD
jgi:uncharacterized SAM-binding protein YcdF (DUF218 family)